MYNEIREAVGTHRSDTEKIIRHIDKPCMLRERHPLMAVYVCEKVS